MWKNIDCAIGTTAPCTIKIEQHGDLIRLKLDTIPIDFTQESWIEMTRFGNEILKAQGFKDFDSLLPNEN